jgi:hypothetical protein
MIENERVIVPRWAGWATLPATLLAVLLVATMTVSAVAPPAAVTLPELPRVYVDTELGPPSGRTIQVRRGGDFQAALNTARLGDVIVLQAGATYVGPFVLPKKEGDGWLVVRSSAPDSNFEVGGVRRVSPSVASFMPRLVASRNEVLSLAAGAHHYYFVGVELSPTPGTFLYTLIGPAVSPRSDADQVHHLVFDRCYLHGDPDRGSRRAFVLNGRHLAVTRSYLADFKEAGADSQALVGWNGPGPIKILDNYLEGAGENVMFGGADPTIPGLVPSDVEIRGNTFSKNPRWDPKVSAYGGSRWTVKALLELKNARRVLIEGNVFEGTWDNALLFTPRNQSGTAPWSTVEDITVRYNWFRRVYSVLRISGHDNEHSSRQTAKILFEHNVAESLSVSGEANPKAIVLLNGPDDVVIRHNTILTTPDQGSSFLLLAGARSKRGNIFTFRDNIVDVGTYGLFAEDPPLGRTSATLLDGHFQSWTFTGNVLVGSARVATNTYPAGQSWVVSLDAVGFLDLSRGNLRLSPTSRHRGAARDGGDPGADIRMVSQALAHYMSVRNPTSD